MRVGAFRCEGWRSRRMPLAMTTRLVPMVNDVGNSVVEVVEVDMAVVFGADVDVAVFGSMVWAAVVCGAITVTAMSVATSFVITAGERILWSWLFAGRLVRTARTRVLSERFIGSVDGRPGAYDSSGPFHFDRFAGLCCVDHEVVVAD